MAGKTQNHGSSNNSVEVHSSGDFGRDFIKTVKSDLIQESMSDIWKQFFGSLDKNEKVSSSGDMAAGQEIFFSTKKAEQKKPQESLRRTEAAPAMNYSSEIARSGEKLSRRETSELEYKISEIIGELKRLVDSSSYLQMEFKQFSVEQAPTSPGKYHLNFFDWVLTMIRNARMQVEDGGAWLGVMKGKKSQGYWDMFKKHGTTFGQSGERSVATQTG